MKLSMYTQILPRLEVFFLEEWIEHHLNMGVDQIHIYDNGMVSIDDGINCKYASRFLDEHEVGVKWIKKPDSDYFLDYTDEEIGEKMRELVEKFKDTVTYTLWRTGQECPVDDRRICQTHGYEKCAEEYPSEWWLHTDPDEYVMLHVHKSIKEFITEYQKVASVFKLSQRVFSRRTRDVPVREITTWGYDLDRIKTLIKSPIVKYDIHDSLNGGNVLNVDPEVMLFYHYRGTPAESAGPAHVAKGINQFDKFDDSMRKYLK